MNTAPVGVHIPLTVAYEGKPVLLETQEHLRTLRAFIDTWISIYEKAEKLPQLPHLPQVEIDTPVADETCTEPPQSAEEAIQTPAVSEEDTSEEQVSTEQRISEQVSGESLNTEDTEAAPTEVSDRTIDRIVRILQACGGSLPTEKVYNRLRSLGWTTASPDVPMALRNLESIARKYKDRVSVSKGTISLIKPITEDTP